MTQSIVLDKYHVNSLEIQKDATSLKDTDAFLAYFKEKIEAHPIATFIATFDHYTHTKSIDGEITEEIKDAKIITFCFGSQIPNTKILAARPRSIAIAELENSFMLEFMDAPNEKLHTVMQEWCKSIED